jgi:hypothetical protein
VGGERGCFAAAGTPRGASTSPTLRLLDRPDANENGHERLLRRLHVSTLSAISRVHDLSTIPGSFPL